MSVSVSYKTSLFFCAKRNWGIPILREVGGFQLASGRAQHLSWDTFFIWWKKWWNPIVSEILSQSDHILCPRCQPERDKTNVGEITEVQLKLVTEYVSILICKLLFLVGNWCTSVHLVRFRTSMQMTNRQRCIIFDYPHAILSILYGFCTNNVIYYQGQFGSLCVIKATIILVFCSANRLQGMSNEMHHHAFR